MPGGGGGAGIGAGSAEPTAVVAPDPDGVLEPPVAPVVLVVTGVPRPEQATKARSGSRLRVAIGTDLNTTQPGGGAAEE